MRKSLILLLVAFLVPSQIFCADAEYKQVLVISGTNWVRVRLPLTDVTGKVRVKARTAEGFGVPLAPSKTELGAPHYLEWQIGYDIPTTNSPSLVPEIRFTHDGQLKYGHELAKIIFEALRLGLLSRSDLESELNKLKKIPASDFEESRAVQVEVSTNNADGFQSAVERLPQFTKTDARGSVQIQLKQKQRAVGYQAMVYVCLPLSEVLAMDGNPRPAGKAKARETVYFDFRSGDGALLLDIIHAFGLASKQHNDDIQKILEAILRISA
jgi:hypothetical protein